MVIVLVQHPLSLVPLVLLLWLQAPLLAWLLLH